MILCSDEEVLKACLHSAKGGNRVELDSQNSEKALPGWRALACKRFNNSAKKYQMKVVPDLHEMLRQLQLIDCSKGAYEMTPDKAQDLVQDQKTKIREMYAAFA